MLVQTAVGVRTACANMLVLTSVGVRRVCADKIRVPGCNSLHVLKRCVCASLVKMAGCLAFVVVVCGWLSPSGLGRRGLSVRPPAVPAHCAWSVLRTARTAKHDGREGGEFVELECTGDQRLANFLRKALPGAGSGVVADSEQVEQLIHLGAVHVRKCKENKKGRRMLPFSRRLEDGQIRKGSLVRVYTRPARFPVGDVDWRSRVLFEDGDYLIVDKPAGIPYQATRSNFRECLVQALTSTLGFKVWGLHRSRSSSLLPVLCTLVHSNAYAPCG